MRLRRKIVKCFNSDRCFSENILIRGDKEKGPWEYDAPVSIRIKWRTCEYDEDKENILLIHECP